MIKSPAAIRSFSLFGESTHLPDVMHCETIAARSVLHGWELSPHRHARLHQVLLLADGAGTASLDGDSFALAAGSLVNVPPGHVHAFRFRQGTQGWVATLADELLDELLARVGDLRPDLGRAGVLAADAAVLGVMEQIWQEFSGHGKARALVLRGLAALLLGWVARSMSAPAAAGASLSASNLVQRFRNLLEQRFAERWSVARYADALAVSATHLSRVARAATGQSALRLIEARSMLEARRQLAYTHLSITTVAYALGYADPAHFTKAFKRDAGVSPREFRERLA